MPYPEYYVEDNKENGADEAEDEFEYSEHLRFSANSYRQSLDENSAALKEYNQRYSENSNRSGSDKRGSKGSSSSRSRASESREYGRPSNHSNRSNTSSQKQSSNSSSVATDKTIALFGVNGITGHYFLQLAVEAGYQVRALILPGFELEDMRENPNLTLIPGTLDDKNKIYRVIRKAAYVVCMLNDCPQALEPATPESKAAQSNYDFIQTLAPLMAQCSACKVLMYQATSFASDSVGSAPMLTNVVKKMAVRKCRRETLQEQDRIIKYISKYVKSKDSVRENRDEPPFQYIITRPSEMVWDRPSRKKLAASKSLPGPFPITNIDLAEFSLNALKMEKLYNSCPYVVQDGI